jgi:hypothetical protein
LKVAEGGTSLRDIENEREQVCDNSQKAGAGKESKGTKEKKDGCG